MSESKLRAAFVSALGLSADVDVPTLEYRSIEQWDSVAHMILIAEIEDTFGIMLETQDVLDMSSYEMAKAIIEKHGIEIG